MTFRNRLALTLLVGLVLLGINLIISRLGNAERVRCVEELQRAVDRKLLVSSIRRAVDDRFMHVDLLSKIDPGATAALSAESLREIERELDTIDNQVRQLESLSAGSPLALVDQFRRVLVDLRQIWEVFYRTYGGANHARALQEIRLRGRPLGIQAIQSLEALSTDLYRQVELASNEFYRISRQTHFWTAGILTLSALLALALAFQLYRHITSGLFALEEGVRAIARGDLGHVIEIESDDELGHLAKAFNSMTRNLKSAQEQLTETARELETRHQDIEKQRVVSESLLSNILPGEVAQELQDKGRVDPKYFEDVSILFLDFVGFTLATEKLAAEELVQLLHDYFTAFDQITSRYQLEKLKTIGDAYMCAGGLPVRRPSHPVDIVMAAFEMIEAVEQRRHHSSAHPDWTVRIGIHTGPVIAGVVGIQKFAFDIWGETVNYSSRMESSSEASCVNLSSATYARVKDFFECQKRGKVRTKDGREVEMYFARAILPKLLDEGECPPPSFVRRYRIYFQKDPPAFPDFLINRIDTGGVPPVGGGPAVHPEVTRPSDFSG